MTTIPPNRLEVGERGWKICDGCKRADGGPTWIGRGDAHTVTVGSNRTWTFCRRCWLKDGVAKAVFEALQESK